MSSQRLITEWINFEYDPKIIKEQREVGAPLVMKGILQKAETLNQNGRVYPKVILEREIRNYQKFIKENRALGELDHPDDSVINLKNASHLVIDMWWDGEALMGKVEILNTPSGNILMQLAQSGVTLGISSRGLGSVRESQGNIIVEEDFQLICFDFVSEPSTPNAFIYPDEKRNMFGGDKFKVKVQESKENQIDDLFKKILRD